ncbi:tetratricopeptide repeat protein [Flavobacterium psychrotrophum]|uniref:tetratricopeptide repeat protein n=1 Tax=Flavobacterium psychrotrophum TaxID=2294119 RepID=UPI000E319281|nr:tetratricopeptide repeat protein [Flavobacterium psychrotrophum]
MKNLAYIVFFIAQIAFAQNFEQGNALYKKGDYAGAAAQYEGILKQGKESAEVYFNLGNAYYKMDKTAPAIYNFEKSLLLDPGNKDAEVNLAFAQKMTIDDIKSTPRVGFSKMLYNATGAYHYNTWAWVAVSFAVFFLLLFLGYYLAGTTLLKRIFFVGMFVALFGIVVSVISAVYVKSQKEKENYAIVYPEVVTVKAEPRTAAQDAFVLHEGTKVNVLETVDNWKKIKLADDSVGWIPNEDIREIKDKQL